MKKILLLTPYPFNQAPSQRFRFEQYFQILNSNDIEYDTQSFLDDNTWSILYNDGKSLQKIIGILKGFIRRFIMLFRSTRYDYIFIHREATPIGPPVIEWILSKILKKKIIFDFDDAIWMQNTSKENAIASILKWHSKTASICKWSSKISCGNQYLADYASKYNQNILVNPTTIDTDRLHIPSHNESNTIIIGWTGTHSTSKYLTLIVPVLRKLSKEFQFIFKVISNKPLNFDLPFLEYAKWSEETEIKELNTFDIGIMPLSNDDWAKGKCGFKALQYMALEIPALVSPVGVNASIVDDGVNGFHCYDKSDWEEKLKILLTDSSKRKIMGKIGRQKVLESYSVNSNTTTFLSLFD